MVSIIDTQEQMNQKKYKCPSCGRPLHPGSWDRFYCDPCNKSWWYEKVLPANINSGAWREMTEEEYRQYKVDTSWAEKGTKAGQESQF